MFHLATVRERERVRGSEKQRGSKQRAHSRQSQRRKEEDGVREGERLLTCHYWRDGNSNSSALSIKKHNKKQHKLKMGGKGARSSNRGREEISV